MKKIFIFILLISAQTKATSEISFNVGELAEKAVLSKTLGDSTSGWFLPFHFTYNYSIESDSVFSTEIIYRSDTHGTFENYSEFLLLLGFERKLVDSSWVWGLKAGAGTASGTIADDSGYSSVTNRDYACSEVVGQISIQKKINWESNWTSSIGGAFLAIVPLSCKNEPQWSAIGLLVHRYVPVLKWEIGYKF